MDQEGTLVNEIKVGDLVIVVKARIENILGLIGAVEELGMAYTSPTSNVEVKSAVVLFPREVYCVRLGRASPGWLLALDQLKRIDDADGQDETLSWKRVPLTNPCVPVTNEIERARKEHIEWLKSLKGNHVV